MQESANTIITITRLRGGAIVFTVRPPGSTGS